jgi:cold shock CspA family protein
MNLSSDLVNQVREGRVVLLLGAGASIDSRTKDGRPCLSTAALGQLLSDTFLGGYLRDGLLGQIAEYAISETDLGRVQSLIRDNFKDLQPTHAHRLLPKFIWHGLATTNYDTLIEQGYEETKDRLQQVRPMIEDRDRIDDNRRDARNVVLLKLHGCITRITNDKCPLILTPDQYRQHRDCRSRLFNTLKEWGSEHPIVFVGHSVQDIDLRAVLDELGELNDFRPRYFIVAPDVDAVKERFWESKKITLIKGTFEDFLKTLDDAIPSPGRSLAIGAFPITSHSIQKYFRTHDSITSSTLESLNNDVVYVNGISALTTVDAKDFYKGYTSGFAPIEQGLDVRRRIADRITEDYFIRDQGEKSSGPEVVLIKAHAGAGKSVILRRLAWDAAHEYDCVCLFAQVQGALSAAPIQELIRSLGMRRLYLFVDDATDRSRELESLLRRMGPEGDCLTVVMAERINEWNIQGQELAPYVTEEFELKYLNPAEIDGLLALLEKHHALGTLAKLNEDDRKRELSEHAGRQLLVALHEATLGQPFESILLDEFEHIAPFEAQRLYLTVCVLNRLNVPVRAGLIARMHGIPFEEFKKRFFAPLEHVVFAQKDEMTGDYQYRARHPHIADIVFRRILKKADERFDCYIRCLKALNVTYAVDWKAFWQMVRARNLFDLFPDLQMVKAIFAAAKETVGEDAHLLHQMGIYEMNRIDGDLAEASRLLNRATELAPYDAAIKHSIAEHRLRAADRSRTALERSKLLKDAANISAGLIRGENTDSYAHHTLVKIEIRELEDGLAASAPEAEIEKLIKDAEGTLYDAQQEFPGDSHLLEAESRLAKVLKDNERATNALARAFDANPRNEFVAVRLARQYQQSGNTQKASEVLKKALDGNGSSRRLHYTFARLLMETTPNDGENIVYHLQRSFTDGDNNYEAQLLYGRQLFLNGRIEESRNLFSRLSKVRVSPETKNRLLYPIQDRFFDGRMSRPQGSYAFITREGQGDSIYVHSANVPEKVWNELTFGTRVRFRIAFTLKGTNAFDLQLG